MSQRRGFALLAVLWIVVALGTLAATAVGDARGESAATGGHIARMRARWAAEGCIAAMQAQVQAGLTRLRRLAAGTPDTLMFANGARCLATGYETGARFPIDSASDDMQARFVSILAGMPEGGRWARDSLLTTYGDGRVNLNAAPREILLTLPGVGPETIRAMETARAFMRPVTSLDDLAQRLSAAARADLYENYPALAGITAFEATSLVIRADGWTAAGGRTSIEVEIVNGGGRAAIVRRRML